jgi:hypothetical protein
VKWILRWYWDDAVAYAKWAGKRKDDFNYGNVPEFSFEPVKVDRVIRDGERVS